MNNWGVARLAHSAPDNRAPNYSQPLSETATLQDLVGQLSARVAEPGVQAGTSRRVRGLNVLGAEDAGLLAAVGRQEHVLCGLRNRDLVRLL